MNDQHLGKSHCELICKDNLSLFLAKMKILRVSFCTKQNTLFQCKWNLLFSGWVPWADEVGSLLKRSYASKQRCFVKYYHEMFQLTQAFSLVYFSPNYDIQLIDFFSTE